MTTYVFLLIQYLGLTTLSGSTDRERILTGGDREFRHVSPDREGRNHSVFYTSGRSIVANRRQVVVDSNNAIRMTDPNA